MIATYYLKLLLIADCGKIPFPTSTTKMALILHRIDLPIKMDSWAISLTKIMPPYAKIIMPPMLR